VHRTPNRTLVGAVVVAATLLLAACGSSGGSDAGRDDTSGGKDATTTTEAQTEAEAQARADSVDLTVDDFPEGWTSAPASDEDEDSPLDQCDPTFSSDEGKVAKHSTDDFTIGSLDAGDGTQMSAQTVVFDDADTAAAAVAVFDDPDVVSCIDEALTSSLRESTGLTIEGKLEDDDLKVDTDEAAGVSGTYVLTAEDGTTTNATVAVLAMSTGDVGTMVTILSLGDSLDFTTLRAPFDKLAELQGAA